MAVMTMDTSSGAQGLAGQKPKPRADFDSDAFIKLLETKGYRVAWSRGALCPCAPVNEQTEQPDPNCSMCDGRGWFYFAPALATTDELLVGDLDDVQLRVVNDNAAVVRAIMTGMTSKKIPYDPIGARVEGMVNATFRGVNKVGYHDRITNLDSLIVYQEILDAKDPAETLVLAPRYPVVRVNLLRTTSTVYTAPTDFTVNARGEIVWNSVGAAPAKDARLALHYLCHPTWLVVEHPHAVRLTQVSRKIKKPLTPAGDPIELPIHAVLRYEFMPELE